MRIILSAVLLSFTSFAYADEGFLTLTVDTQSDEGTVRAAVYESAEAFDAGKMITGVFAKAETGLTKIEFKGIKPGAYGIALFHDKNGNEKLDRNFLGAPNEPFGFSNNPEIGFSAPSFESFTFDYDGGEATLSILLNGS